MSQVNALVKLNNLLEEDNKKLRAENKETLEALKMAYRKHHLHDDSIGWEELSGVMHDAICEAMGDKEYMLWLGGI